MQDESPKGTAAYTYEKIWKKCCSYIIDDLLPVSAWAAIPRQDFPADLMIYFHSLKNASVFISFYGQLGLKN
jgi:hypothetical protein